MKTPRIRILAALAILLAFCLPAAAGDSGTAPTVLQDKVVAIVALQIAACLILTRLVLPHSRRWGLPDLVAQIGVGVLLGPAIFGGVSAPLRAHLFPDDNESKMLLEMLRLTGVVLLLFQTGLGLNTEQILKSKRPALWLGIGGVVMPVTVGFIATLGFCALSGYQPVGATLPYAFFMANIMAISSMIIATKMLKEMAILPTPFGQTILCGYAVNTVVGRVFFAWLFAFIGSGNSSLIGLLLKFVVSIGGIVAAVKIGPKAAERLVSWSKRDLGLSGVLISIVALTSLSAIATDQLGLSFVFGIFLAGIVLGSSSAVTEQLKSSLNPFVEIGSVVYFNGVGLSVDFRGATDWPLVMFVTIGSIAFKYYGAYFSARFGGQEKAEWRPTAIAFVPGGVDGLIFGAIAIGYNLIGEKEMVAIAIATLVSSIVAGPLLKHAIGRAFPVRPTTLKDTVVRFTPNLARWLSGPDRATVLRNALGAVIPPMQELGSHLTVAGLSDAIEETRAHLPGGEVFADGIAFVHCRVDDLPETRVFFFYAGETPLWEAEKKVRLVVLLLADRSAKQLNVLAPLARLLHSLPSDLLLGTPESPRTAGTDHRLEVEAVIQNALEPSSPV